MSERTQRGILFLTQQIQQTQEQNQNHLSNRTFHRFAHRSKVKGLVQSKPKRSLSSNFPGRIRSAAENCSKKSRSLMKQRIKRIKLLMIPDTNFYNLLNLFPKIIGLALFE